MARTPYPDPSQEFTKVSVQLNLFCMLALLAHAGPTGGRVLSLGNALLSQLELEPKLSTSLAARLMRLRSARPSRRAS